MNPLIVALPYCSKDITLAKNLLQWMKELGNCPGHCCVLFPDSTLSKEEQAEVKTLAKPIFEYVGSIPIAVPPVGYPPNHMFMMAAQQIMFSYKLPWLWLEPDAVPLRPGWLSKLSEEYAGSPKRLLGCLIEAEQAGLPPVHLSGVAIYPPDAYAIYDPFSAIKNSNVTWDMEAASAAVPRAKNSLFMQHFWGKKDLPPTFVEQPVAGQPENALPLSFIKKDAVLFHRNKDGSLINLLRKQFVEAPVERAPSTAPEIPVKRKPGRPRIVPPAQTD